MLTTSKNLGSGLSNCLNSDDVADAKSNCRSIQNAYKTFCKGGVIPLVIGAYGETNDEFQDLLKVCARMAVR